VQTIGFNHSKLVMRMAGGALGAVLMVVVSLRLQMAAVPLVLAAFLAGIAALAAFALMNGKPALELDEKGITINNLLTSQTLAWDEVADVRVQTMTLYYLGFIPAVRHAHLIVKTKGSWLNAKSIRASTRLMALPPGGPGELIARIEAARTSAGRISLAPFGTASEPVEPTCGFDPDAAIARYLARKAGEEAGATPPRPVFGRKQV
jgi:hypothetical protein